MKLSIIIPVYNEEKTVKSLLKAVNKVKFIGVEKEIIIIDDGSIDTSAFQISNLKSQISNFKFIRHKKNLGKGAAVRTGIKEATGDYLVIQDADLEYNPQEIKKLIAPVLQAKAEVVYGTRLKRLPNFKRDEKALQPLLHYLGNKLLSLITSILYAQWITDMETCYKLFPKKALVGFQLRSRGFEFEPEITAKLLKKKYKIIEVPITTKPRNYKEGKKLYAFKDGPKALWALIKYRFID
ncbi:glycosyltransferase family 2 protein [Candidatus Roizmanbacteria bacterium]|nr:glycosyltransferase family 2 protein [Candidatus Roizmanbacteria bacterium]